jgi:predicted ATPase/class 3 adenylate cyclase
LFTDIEGSTAIARRLGDGAFAGLLADHNRLVRATLRSCDGVEHGTQGDSFFVSFTSPSSCITAAIEIQRNLAGHEWPHGEHVSVRMGIHTGEATPVPWGFAGYEVHRASRIAAVSHGGQVLLSESSAALVRDVLPPGASLKSLGSHRLKDLGRPEELYQLQADGLRVEFAPLRSLDNPELPNNLPASLSPFVGRARELDDVRSMIAESRLVTLTGSGGSGKTRLALQVAAEFLGRGEGVWHVDLSNVADPERVPSAVNRALELQEEWDCSPLESLLHALRDQDVLITLDNCEQVIDSVAKLAESVGRACPKVRLLTTSREPLGVEGERIYRVPSLSLPAEDPIGLEDLEGSDAAELFLVRARSHEPSFTIDDSTVPLVASICRRLDGIPFALELAAARVPTMSLAGLDEGLDQRFRLLTDGSRTSSRRQQTLWEMVAWSYDLLSDAERGMLRNLAVFAAGFDIDAAVAVCMTCADDAMGVADLVGSLVNKSLVVAERSSQAVRFRLLETIRQFATERFTELDGPSRAAEVKRLHAEHFLGLCETARPELTGPHQGDWLKRLDLEHDNLDAAFEYLAADPTRVEQVLRLGIASASYFSSRLYRAPIDFLQTALERDATVSPELRAKALVSLARLMNAILPSELSHGPASALCREALGLASASGDDGTRALTLVTFSQISRRSGDPALALTLARDALEVAERLDDARLIGLASYAAGYAQTSLIEGRAYFERALASYRRAGDLAGICLSLQVLAAGTFTTIEEVREAAALEDEAMEIAEAIGSTSHLIGLWINRGISSYLLGDVGPARTYARRVLIAGRRFGTSMWTLPAVFVLSCCDTSEGEYERAAQLSGAYERIDPGSSESLDWEWSPLELEMRDGNRALLIEHLGADPFAKASSKGKLLGMEEIAELALGRTRR